MLLPNLPIGAYLPRRTIPAGIERLEGLAVSITRIFLAGPNRDPHSA